MYLIHLLLPLYDNHKQKFAREKFEKVRHGLTETFGGVTAFLRSPAIGLWKENETEVTRDEVVLFEVMSPELDMKWWKEYRGELEKTFRQDQVLIWAEKVTKL